MADLKDQMRRFNKEVFENGNLAAIDDLLTEDFIEHQAPPPGVELKPGREGVKEFLKPYFAAFTAVSQLVFLPLAALVVAGILYALFTAILGGDATFKQTLAVVELRQHRRTLDDDWLDEEYAKKNKDDDDQEDIAKELDAFREEAVARVAAYPRHLDVAVVACLYKPDLGTAFLALFEHNSREQPQ